MTQNSLYYHSLNQLKALKSGQSKFIKFNHNGLNRKFRILSESEFHLELESEIGTKHHIVPRKDPRTKS